MSTLTLLPISLGHNPLLEAIARDYCNTPATPMHMPARSSHGRSGTGIHYQLIPYFIKLLMASKPILSVTRLCNSCSAAHPCHVRWSSTYRDRTSTGRRRRRGHKEALLLELLYTTTTTATTAAAALSCIYVRRIWSICTFDQMCSASGKCAIDQSPNHDSNPNTNPNPNPNPNPNRNPIPNPNRTLNFTSTKCCACMQIA